MKCSRSILFPALVSALLLAAGCASIPEDRGFGQVSQEVEQRTGYWVAWHDNGSADKAVEARIDQWLAQGLNLHTAVQIGLLKNNRLQAAYESLGIAQAALVQAGLLKNPVFEGALRFPTGGGGSVFELGVVQSFLDVLMIPLRRKVAQAEAETVKLETTAAVMDLAFEIRVAFYSLLGRTQGLELSRELLLAADLAFQTAQRLKSSGAMDALKLAERQYAFEQTRLEVADLELAIVRDRERLNRLLGLWGGRTGWQPKAELRPVPDKPLDLAKVEKRAIEQSLDLEIVRSRLLAAARRMGVKNITSIIGEFEAGLDAEREGDGSWMVGPMVALEIPVFDQGQPARTKARAEMRRGWEEYTALAIDIRSRAREARHRLVQSRARSLHYSQVLLPLRQEITRLTQQHYNAMQVGVFRFLEIKQMEVVARRDYLDELLEYWSARAELEQLLAGRLSSNGLPLKEGPTMVLGPGRQGRGPLMLKKINMFNPFNLGRRKFFQSLGLAGALILGRKMAPGRAEAADTMKPRTRGRPSLPWAEAAGQKLPPGRPGQDYTPVTVPNGTSLPFKIKKGVKVFHLIAEPIVQEVAPGLTVRTWGYNGRTPGPVIEAVRGDRVRIYVTNRLPTDHTVHWHAMLLPSGMDGVSGLNQRPIKPGETFRYEYYLPHAGTFMYHSHHDSMTQDGMGLVGMMVVHPRRPWDGRPERDFALMLHEWRIEVGAGRPDPNEMTDFNVLTINGRAFPGTEPLVARLGDRVRIRFGNLSAMDHHPIHLHGYNFKIVETDGGPIPKSAQWPETTVLVPVGSARAIDFLADNPGDWIMHCHMTHHMMNQMGHGIPNMVGADMSGLEEKIRDFIPGYMTMGTKGMGGMAGMGMAKPENSISMLGAEGPYSPIGMGGMTTILKVRDKLESYDDPGWYDPPAGTMTRKATRSEMEADGIETGGG